LRRFLVFSVGANTGVGKHEGIPILLPKELN
jgi:hypothetical protein